MNKRKRKIISRAKRTGVTAQAVELLPRKHRALSSNSSTDKRPMLKRDISKEHSIKQ
jgi:hypothetical protein